MHRKALLTLLAIVGPGCWACADLDLAGINEGSAYIEELLDYAAVAKVICPDSLPVGGSAQCVAFNAAGTQLASSGQSVVKWMATPTTSAQVDLSGVVYAGVPDVVTITAEGPKDSTASTQIVIY